MACEERDAAKRLLAEKQRAALSPEPSALSLNPEDSELEGGATVGPQATVYTQTAQFEKAKKKWLRRGPNGGGAWLLTILPVERSTNAPDNIE